MSAVLGVSFGFHDAAAVLVRDGVVVAAVEQERMSRTKHDASLPVGAIAEVCALASVRAVDHVVFYERPLAKLDRMQSVRRGRLRGAAAFHRSLLRWSSSLLWVESELTSVLATLDIEFDGRVEFLDHHHSHAASAFYASGFPQAAVVCLDGVGEWSSSSIAFGDGPRLDVLEHGAFPHSVGLFYSAITELCGFKVNSGEYKLMGLAPYGVPRFRDRFLEDVISVDPSGGVELHMEMFDFLRGTQMASSRLGDLVGLGPLAPPVTQTGAPSALACDVAASAQAVCDLVLARSVAHAVELTGCRNLALAGGVALNCVAVGRAWADGVCDEVFVQPAASDAGGALGAALAKAAQLGELPTSSPTRRNLVSGVGARWADRMAGSLLGSPIVHDEVREVCERFDLVFDVYDEGDVDRFIASALAAGGLVAVARGAMEFGPRALGNRSILADPRDPTVQSRLNLAVKQRESFRPFAPAVLEHRADQWFAPPFGTPYMTATAEVLPGRRHQVPGLAAGDVLDRVVQVRSHVPAVTHVDFSARVQLVGPDGPLFGVLSAFEELSGCPMVVNTSFNRRGEPIVRTPLEALRCFWHSDLTHLVLGRAVIVKADQHIAPSDGPPDVPLDSD